MLRNLFGPGVLALAFLLIPVAALPAQPPMGPPPPPPELPPFGKFSKTPEVIQLLNTEIDTKPFQSPLAFGEALGLITEKFAGKGKTLSLLVDEQAFKAEPPPKEKMLVLTPGPLPKITPLLDSPVKLPALPKKMTVGLALHVFLGELPRVHPTYHIKETPTYVIRQGAVVITTAKAASIKSLLQEKVTASFHQKPLYEALYVLSDLTGASIVIDPKVMERAFMPVSATFAHDTTLESALTLLTDMAGLRSIVVGDGIYVTTTENADKLRYQPKY